MRIFVTLVVFLIASATNAQEQKVSSVINLYGVTFTYGIPPWVTPGDTMLDQVKTFRDQKGPSFLIEFIPSDEEFESWNKMFAISAYRNTAPVPIDLWQNVSLDTLRKVCQGYKETVLVKQEKVALVQVVCPRIAGVPLKGYEGDIGQVAVFAFLMNGSVLINHRMEWRGAAFDGEDESSWPVEVSEVEAVAQALQGAKATGGAGVIAFQ